MTRRNKGYVKRYALEMNMHEIKYALLVGTRFICMLVEVHAFEIRIYSMDPCVCAVLFKYVLKLMFVRVLPMCFDVFERYRSLPYGK